MPWLAGMWLPCMMLMHWRIWVMNKEQRPVQYFSDDYIKYCQTLSKEQILQFLEDFKLLQQAERVKTSAPKAD
jgi:hypothetical protein